MIIYMAKSRLLVMKGRWITATPEGVHADLRFMHGLPHDSELRWHILR